MEVTGAARQKRAEADAARKRRDCRCCRMQAHARSRIGEIKQVMHEARTEKDSKEVVVRNGVSVSCTFRLRCGALYDDASLELQTRVDGVGLEREDCGHTQLEYSEQICDLVLERQHRRFNTCDSFLVRFTS